MTDNTKYPIGGYAPGHYQCKCCTCGELFMGDKMAVQCEPCASQMFEDKEPSKLEDAADKVAGIVFNHYTDAYNRDKLKRALLHFALLISEQEPKRSVASKDQTPTK